MSLENALQSLELHSNFETKPSFELPDDSGMEVRSYKLPDDSGIEAVTEPSTYFDLNSMKRDLGKTYQEIKEDKPLNAPNLAKWFDSGGSLTISESDGKPIWTYTDAEGRSVSYIDGKVQFPPEAKHPVVGDIDIGEFTGDRQMDKKLYLDKLEEEYGLTDIPDGYDLHHDVNDGVMQLIKTDYHKKFTHAGGHSMYKGG